MTNSRRNFLTLAVSQMKKKFLHQIGLSLILAIVVANTAQADVLITIDGSSSDVIVTAVGILDLTGAAVHALNPPPGSYTPGIIAGGASWYVAPGSGGAHDSYFLTTVDVPFGTSTTFANAPTSISGDSFFLFGAGVVPANVGVNAGYVSGDPIFSQMTLSNTSLANLTLIEGTYNFALPNDQITLVITSAVPEPTSTLGLTTLGLVLLSRRRRREI